MKITRATYEANGKTIEMRRDERDGICSGYHLAVKVSGHREVYHEMGLGDAADLAVAVSVATAIYRKDMKGRPACTNSDVHYLKGLMSDLAGC